MTLGGLDDPQGCMKDSQQSVFSIECMRRFVHTRLLLMRSHPGCVGSSELQHGYCWDLTEQRGDR